MSPPARRRPQPGAVPFSPSYEEREAEIVAEASAAWKAAA